jgi:uncharacterized BrkB/YihY/UPF0761 family membrane protein
MSACRLGTTLLSVARRVCEPESIDTVAVPIVADIQFEAHAVAHRSRMVRAWTRVRGYAAFFNAIALTVLLGHGRSPMKSQAFAWFRLLIAIPAALVVTLGVQLATTRLFGTMLVHPGPRLANGLVLAEGINSVKVVCSPFMSAAFFWTIYLVAPRHRRRPVALAALVAIGLWGALMVFGSVMPGPQFHGWLFGIGLALWLGGGLSYWLARRLRKPEAQVA